MLLAIMRGAEDTRFLGRVRVALTRPPACVLFEVMRPKLRS
jgi:hypothetical protein